MSPGPLSKAHRDLEGPLQCAKHHVFGSGAEQFRCLDCHQEIYPSAGSVGRSGVADVDCAETNKCQTAV